MHTSDDRTWPRRVLAATAALLALTSLAAAARADDSAPADAPDAPPIASSTSTAPAAAPAAVSGTVPVVGAAVEPEGGAAAATVDLTRGLVADAACPGLLLVVGTDLCSHGADDHAAHPHTAAGGSASPAPSQPAAGSCAPATDGPRVRAIYAVARGDRDRYADIVPYVRASAAAVDEIFRRSSGGTRTPRWATDATCRVDVARVVVSPAARDAFGTLIEELRAAGFGRADRRYVVWFDADVYCGVATLWGDDRADLSNRNNGATAAYGRVDRSCWGGWAEAHELVHMLGGVQASAPNATRAGHCTDESDVMCYADAAGVRTRAVCPSGHEHRLDCGGDDYFNTAPRAGSYLASHWNVANSAFLTGAPSRPTTQEHRFDGTLDASRRSETRPFRAGAGAVTVRVQHATGASSDVVASSATVAASAVDVLARSGELATSRPATWNVRVRDGRGQVLASVASDDGTADLGLSVPAAGTYTLEVQTDGAGSWSAAVVTPIA